MQETQESGKKRVWPALSDEVYADLIIFALEDKRKPSDMAAIFIENAIKERKRQRNKNGKKNSSSDNAKDIS
jgi:hypothetical protein